MAEEAKELSPTSVIEMMTKGEIESQIDIAKRFPRSMEKFLNRATEMACMDEETALSCIYRRPVGKEGGKQIYAEGLSVRMAEIVGACYGNLRVYATLLSQTDRQVVARGMAIDLEANFASSSEIVEATVDKNGRAYSERMSAIVAKAALAKARRDATFQVVPKALAKPVEQAVRKLLMGESKSIGNRRAAVVNWIGKLGIEPERVWTALGIAGPADLGVDEIETLTGIRTALKEGDTTIDDAFPAPEMKVPQTIKEPVNAQSTQPSQPTNAKNEAPSQAHQEEAEPGQAEAAPANGEEKPEDKPAKKSVEEMALEIIAGYTAETFPSPKELNPYLKGQPGQVQARICKAFNDRKKELGL